MHIRKLAVLAALVLALAAGPLHAASKGLDFFFKKSQYAAFQFSPNGKELAGLVPIDDRMNIAIINLEDMTARVVTSETRQDISGFMWANDNRLLYFMDKDGSESFGVFAINSDGSQFRMLVEPMDLAIARGQAVLRYTNVIDRLDNDEEHVLVVSNDRNASYPDVYRMNIMTGRKTVVQRNPGNVVGWFTDWDGKVIGGGFQDGLVSGWSVVDPATGELKEVTRARFDEHSFGPAGLKGDGKTGWVSSRLTPDGKPRDKAAIYEYNFETLKMGELVYENADVDLNDVLMNEKTRDMVGVSYMVGKPEVVYTDERWAKLMLGINQALPDTVNIITSTDEAETRAIVTAYSDVQPPVYYIYDFNARRLEFLAEARPWVKPEEMSEMKPITFTSRDGVTLHGYLTVPKGSEGKKVPLVVNPHGGPWARDGWGYNNEHQFLADRGYAVVQVNFRGSTGFGMDHYLKSKKQWGQAMQNDVTDAVQWVVEQGIADPERVCIYGASYGGYAAMAGLTYTPDLYKCGINYVGVTDLPLLFKTAPDAWASGMEEMYEMVGDYKEEREFLEQWSPSQHADKIKAPVFMAYGRQDPRVSIEHAEVMEKALKANNKTYELMVKKDEGHGFRKQENVYDFYGRVESFLAENLKP